MVYCFNCKKQTHGFKSCKKSLQTCKTCQTKGHTSEHCEIFSKMCYRCCEEGIMKSKCKKHDNLKRCGAIIMDQEKRILLVQGHSDVWSIPKGHQKHMKEPYSECAMREVYEETGLKLKITKNFKKIEIGNIVYYLVELNDFYKKFIKIQDTEEIKTYDWINVKDILQLKKINWSLKKIGTYLETLSL